MVATLEKPAKSTATLLRSSQPLRKIERPGEYVIADSPGSWFGGLTMIKGDHPEVTYHRVPEHLKESFKGIKHREFQQFDFQGKLVTLPSDSRVESGTNYFILNDQICELEISNQNSGGHGNCIFEIKDIEALKVVEGQVVTTKEKGEELALSKKNDGKVSFHLSYQFPRWQGEKPKLWAMFVDYQGKNPGTLVNATLNYINSEIERMEAPVWIKPRK
jgi:hypothetical protein